jgi:hypothetical protein
MLAVACSAVLLAPSSALAGGAPTVSTGAAHAISYGSATLAGSVNPHGSNTSYYFQYGPTRAYGGQTALADAGAGTGSVHVTAAVGGLQPLTKYHFRLVAVNAAGAIVGADRSFRTTKVPLSLQILTSPDPTSFGGPVQVEGTLSGTGSANREVVLQANAFPFTAGFADVGNPELTSATGAFSFTALGLTTATQYRVITTTSPPVLSPIATENVAVRIRAHVGRTKRAHHVRIYGRVTPAIDGMEVGIMRITHARNVLVAGTVLHHANATSSRFSRVIRVRRGIYRVLVRVTNGAQTSAYSSPLLIR